MRTRPLLAFALIASAALTGCSDRRASFEASDMQSLTVIVFRNLPWKPYQLEVVVRNEPACQRRYPLQTLPDPRGPMQVYAYDASRYAFLAADAKYVFDLSNCEITRFRDVPDLKPEDLLGEFAYDAAGTFAFMPRRR